MLLAVQTRISLQTIQLFRYWWVCCRPPCVQPLLH